MVRKITSLTVVLALALTASSAFAVDVAQTAAGGEVTIDVDTSLIQGAQDVSFQPSSQVNIDGATVRTSFALISGHDAVRGKDSGQNYGMAADSASVWWSQAPAGTFPTMAATNSSGFGTEWYKN